MYILGYIFFLQELPRSCIPVSAVLGWNSVLVYVINWSCRFRLDKRPLFSVMCISPSPLTFTPSTSAATLNVPRDAEKFSYREEQKTECSASIHSTWAQGKDINYLYHLQYRNLWPPLLRTNLKHITAMHCYCQASIKIL